MKDIAERIIRDSIKTKEILLSSQISNMERAAWILINCLRSGGKVLIFGNGGSAADSQHMAAELVGRFKAERKAMAAIALTTNTSTVTAIANDYGYDAVFSRQIEAVGKRGDVAVAISTSGNSTSVINAVEKARSAGMETIGITGGGGGRLKGLCDVSIIAASADTPRIQESHILIIHALCELVEGEMIK
jgi:D-sedoheptulose 7-phosphate isomerase